MNTGRAARQVYQWRNIFRSKRRIARKSRQKKFCDRAGFASRRAAPPSARCAARSHARSALINLDRPLASSVLHFNIAVMLTAASSLLAYGQVPDPRSSWGPVLLLIVIGLGFAIG